MREKGLHEELSNVVQNAPLFPGKTISHAQARACSDLGWIQRNAQGNWIPTAEGLKVYREQAVFLAPETQA